MASSVLPAGRGDLAAYSAPLTAGVLDETAVEQLARVFRALGDRHRVRLLSMIATADGGEACICDLTAPVGLSQSTVSHHMKQLVEAGLVTREQRGKWAYYCVVPQAIQALSSALRNPVAEDPALPAAHETVTALPELRRPGSNPRDSHAIPLR